MECSFFLIEDENVFNALMVRAREQGVKPQVWHAFRGSDIAQIVDNINGPSVTFIHLIGPMVVTHYSFEHADPINIDFAERRIIVMYRKNN